MFYETDIIDSIDLRKITRITVVTGDGLVFERYDAFQGVVLSIQDEGRTLKVFPHPSAKPPLPVENEGEAEDTKSPSFQ